MRAVLLSACALAAALVLLPVAGASCHWCGATDPVAEHLRQLLP